MQLRFQSQMEEWIGHQHLQGLNSPTKLMRQYSSSRRTLPMSRQRNHGDKGSMTHKPRQQQRDIMRVLSQFMCMRMCCLKEKQVMQIMLTLTDRFTHLFLSHTFIYRIAGNYRGCTFSLFGSRALSRNFRLVFMF